MRRQPIELQTDLITSIELTPKSARGRRAKRGARIRSLAVGVVGALALSALSINPLASNLSPIAEATGSSNKVGLYLSAPMVMGSSITEAAQRANFDLLPTDTAPIAPVTSLGSCPSSLPGIGALTFSSPDHACSVSPSGPYGGASTDTAERTFGGVGTRYMGVPYYGSGSERSITFNLSGAAKYVGFWWSGGNAGNLVRFFDDQNNLVAEFASADVEAKLSGAGTVTDLANRTYQKSEYFGNPVYYTSLTQQPTSGDGTNGNSFIYTYLNLFVEGSLNIRKVQFAGPGFEFDNLAFSTVEQTPEDTMVQVLEKSSPELTWNPTTNLLLSASPATPSQLATKNGDGVISYAVKNAGATGCTVNSSTGVITYTGLGDCIITATVTGTSTFLKSTKDITFKILETLPVEQDSGSSGSTGSTPAATQSLPVDPCTIPTSELSATTNRTFSGFAINSAVLTKKMKKQIKKWVKAHPEEVCVSVAGFTMGPRVLPTDPKLAKDRARAVRAYIKSLRPDASFTPITSRTQRLVGDDIRRAKVTLRF